MSRTVKSMLDEAAQLASALEKGKIKGKNVQKAKYKIGNLRYRAKKKQGKVVADSNVRLKAGQGFLPGMLKGLNPVRIEELVAEKLFQAARKAMLAEQAPAAKTKKTA